MVTDTELKKEVDILKDHLSFLIETRKKHIQNKNKRLSENVLVLINETKQRIESFKRSLNRNKRTPKHLPFK